MDPSAFHEQLFHSSKDGPYLSAMIDLTMFIATFGEQRTPAEFQSWLAGIGFQTVRAPFLAVAKRRVRGLESLTDELNSRSAYDVPLRLIGPEVDVPVRREIGVVFHGDRDFPPPYSGTSVVALNSTDR